MLRNEDGTFSRSLIYGVGIDDVAGTKEYVENGVRKTVKSFQDWKNMLRRCYSNNGEYVGVVTVCDDWKIYSNFKRWFDLNYKDGCQLDKDMGGGLLYSPNHCCYIPQELNHFIVGVNDKVGVYFDKSRNKFQSYTKSFRGGRIRIGRFNTESEALYMAKMHKFIELGRVFELYKSDGVIASKLSSLMDGVYFKFLHDYKS